MKAIANNMSPNHIYMMAPLEDEVQAILGLSPPFDPDATQAPIEECLSRIVKGTDYSHLSTSPVDALGIFWGWTVKQSVNWDWTSIDIYVNDEYDHNTIGVCDRELRFMLLPQELFQKLVKQPHLPGPKQIFQAIKEGQLPKAKPRELVNIGDLF